MSETRSVKVISFFLAIVIALLLLLGFLSEGESQKITLLILAGVIYIALIFFLLFPRKKVRKIVVKKVKEKPKKEKKKSKYVASTYNEKYHLRTCRFIGAIKPQYLLESDDMDDFKKKKYKACKACKPNRKK